MRGRSGPAGQVEPRRRVEDPAWVEAGRPAGEIAPERQKVRCGPERVADGEAQVAQRAFVGVEAQDLGGGRGALQRQAGAQRPGGGRVGAQEGVEQARGRRRRRTADRPPLPFRSPAPRPGSAPAAERLAVSGAFAEVRLVRARLPERRRNARRRGSARRVGEQVEIGANHLGMVNRWRRFVTLFERVIRPACRGVAMSDKIALSDMIRSGSNAMRKAAKFRP